MKKQILAVMALTVLSVSYAQADQKTRINQVATVFLNQANNSKTLIAKKLQSVREEKTNGFCSESCVLPKRLKSSDIRLVVASSSEYQGKFEGDENGGEVVGGYEEWTMAIFVPVKDISYGGRIRSMDTVEFSCTYEASSDEKGKIACVEKNASNGTAIE